MGSRGNKCRHGYVGADTRSWSPGKSTLAVVAKHRKTCPNADPIWHSGLLGKVICCLTCGKKIY